MYSETLTLYVHRQSRTSDVRCGAFSVVVADEAGRSRADAVAFTRRSPLQSSSGGRWD